MKWDKITGAGLVMLGIAGVALADKGNAPNNQMKVRASIVERIVRQNGRHGGAGAVNLYLLTACTFGKRRTSPIKFASKGDVLSRLHARAKVRGIFKSTTGRTTTVSGVVVHRFCRVGFLPGKLTA